MHMNKRNKSNVKWQTWQDKVASTVNYKGNGKKAGQAGAPWIHGFKDQSNRLYL